MKVSGWKELHPSIGLQSNHGFTFVQLKYIANNESYISLLRTIGVDEDDIRAEEEKSKAHNNLFQINPIPGPDRVYPLLRYYLSETATSTFAIAQKNTFHDLGVGTGAYFYIGFRNPKDAFVFLLRFPQATRAKMIRRDLPFYIRVAEDDTIPVIGNDQLDEKNRVVWNREDPQGFL